MSGQPLYGPIFDAVVSDIEDNELQPREQVEEEDDNGLGELGESMVTEGGDSRQINPVILVRIGEGLDGRPLWKIVVGTRRLRSARNFAYPTLEAREAFIDPDDEEAQMDIITEENRLRKDLRQFEQCRQAADWYRVLKKQGRGSYAEVGRKLGITGKMAENRVRAWEDSEPKKNHGEKVLRHLLRASENTMSFVSIVRKFPTAADRTRIVDGILSNWSYARVEQELAVAKERQKKLAEMPARTPSGGAIRYAPSVPAPDPAHITAPPIERRSAPQPSHDDMLLELELRGMTPPEPQLGVMELQEVLQDALRHLAYADRIVGEVRANPLTTQDSVDALRRQCGAVNDMAQSVYVKLGR